MHGDDDDGNDRSPGRIADHIMDETQGEDEDDDDDEDDEINDHDDMEEGDEDDVVEFEDVLTEFLDADLTSNNIEMRRIEMHMHAAPFNQPLQHFAGFGAEGWVNELEMMAAASNVPGLFGANGNQRITVSGVTDGRLGLGGSRGLFGHLPLSWGIFSFLFLFNFIFNLTFRQ